MILISMENRTLKIGSIHTCHNVSSLATYHSIQTIESVFLLFWVMYIFAQSASQSRWYDWGFCSKNSFQYIIFTYEIQVKFTYLQKLIICLQLLQTSY